MRTRTTLKEKCRRFDYINGEFMSKYLDLVSFARWGNADEHLNNGEYQTAVNILGCIKEMRDKYPDEVKELEEDDSNWVHGFNSGVLAYARFLATYCEDGLWELDENNADIAEHEKVITINGKKYIEFDGRADAEEGFPELYT